MYNISNHSAKIRISVQSAKTNLIMVGKGIFCW